MLIKASEKEPHHNYLVYCKHWCQKINWCFQALFRPQGKIGNFKNIMTGIHIVLDMRETGLVNSWAAGAQGMLALVEKPWHCPDCSDGSWSAIPQTSVSMTKWEFWCCHPPRRSAVLLCGIVSVIFSFSLDQATPSCCSVPLTARDGWMWAPQTEVKTVSGQLTGRGF